jgi:uncharacterized protein with PQ loop repeat
MEPYGFCIYNTTDKISVFFGLLSIGIWCVALLPQIIKTYRKKSVESLSFIFWLCWVLGDTFNFIGSILVKNIFTNILLSCIFVIFTTIGFVQYVYYRNWIHIEEENEAGEVRIDVDEQLPNTDLTTTNKVIIAFILTSLFTGNVVVNIYTNDEDIRILIGKIIGWTTVMIYVMSRVPQIRKMLITKHIKSISPYLFLLTFIGNFSQFIAVVVREEFWLSNKIFLNQLPWAITPLICGIQDIVILYLYYRYS